MTCLKWTSIFAMCLSAAAVCGQQNAQQKFPLHQGEWEVSIPIGASPVVLRVCLNDELWTKALTQNPSCSIEDLNVTGKAVTYAVDCPSPTVEMKGKVEMTFDGKEHMIARSNVQISRSGQISNATQTIDYRWKAAVCSPDDLNIKDAKSP